MMSLNHRILSVAAVLLLTGGSTFGQAVNTPQQDRDRNTVPWNNTQQKDPLAAPAMQNYVPPAYSLPWSPIKHTDIRMWNRVVRDIDAREKENISFSNDQADAKTPKLINILIEGVLSGKIKAYDPAVTNYTKELSRENVIALLTPGKGGKGINPNEVVKYQIKEDWLYLNDNSMTVRILGIAPLRQVTGADGKVSDEPLFLLYYPDCRTYLAEHKVTGGEFPGKYNWDELFHMRIFKSRIIKTTNMGERLNIQTKQ